MVEDNPFSSIFSQENWPADVAYWLFNGKVKVPIGCEVCGYALRYRPEQDQTDDWEQRYYCPHCGWPDEAAISAVPIPAIFLECDEGSEADC